MAYSGVSIVDYLNLQNKDSSYANRKKLYQSTFGANAPYSGTAEQNTALLNSLRGTPQPVSTTPISKTGTSVVPTNTGVINTNATVTNTPIKATTTPTTGTAGTPAIGTAIGTPATGTSTPTSSTTSQNPTMPTTILRQGSTGNDVTTLQTMLKQAGYDIAVDGIYGPKTAAAVTAYQKSKGLQVDGIAGPQTSGSLFNRNTSGATTPTVTPATATPATGTPATGTTAGTTMTGTTPTTTTTAGTTATSTAVPEWQVKLDSYKTDKNAAIAEVIRAKSVYAVEKEAYEKTHGVGTFYLTDRAKQISHWADQVREAAGLSDEQYGKSTTVEDAQTYAAGGTPTVQTKDVGVGEGVGEGEDFTPTGDANYNSLLEKIYGMMNKEFEFEPSESREDYTKRITEQINSILAGKKSESQAALAKARGDITSESSIAQRDIDTAYQQQLQDLTAQAEKIRQAYESNKRNLETQKAEDMPEFRSQRKQASVQTQQAVKRIQEFFAKRGLGSSGQVASEVAGTYNQGLGMQSAVNTSEGNYIRQYLNKLADVEGNQSVSLAENEATKGKAGLTKQAGVQNIIERVNNQLAGLSIDEKTMLEQLAQTRQQMLTSIESEYSGKTQAEMDAAFDRYIKEMGVDQDSAEMIRQTLDDINRAKEAAAELQYKKEQSAAEMQYKKEQSAAEQAYNNKIADVEAKYKSGVISVDARNAALREAELQWDKSPDNPKNKDSKSTEGMGYQDVLDDAMAMKNKINTIDGTPARMYSDTDIASFVINSSLSDDEIVRLLNQLGIDLKKLK